MRLDINKKEYFDNLLASLLNEYKDLPISTLSKTFNINVNAKNQLNLITEKIVHNHDIFLLDRDIRFKTICLDKYGRLKESMSLPPFKYQELCKETWEHSALREYLYKKVFIFTVYKFMETDIHLHRLILWQPSLDIIDSGMREVWEKTKKLLLTGKVVKYINDNQRYFTYFPSSTENPYLHVRPHAANRFDTYPLPVPDCLTGMTEYPKHSFWFNRSYVLKIISDGGML